MGNFCSNKRHLKHALSFDIEDWFHVVGISKLEDRSSWDDFESIVEDKTSLILDILAAYNTKATFFMLGWVARKYPNLSKKIAKAGHELGSHSFWHRRVYTMKPEDFKQDLAMSIDVLEQQTGQKVKGFRAPSFSITPGTEWAFEIMGELGLLYDASLFPASRGHGGYPCLQEIHPLSLSESDHKLIEFPMSIKRFGMLKIPFSGGGYMRLLPSRVIQHYFKYFEDNNIPVVVYLHPRDFAPEQPRVKMPMHRKFKSYIGISSTEQKLKGLLGAYSFDTCMSVIITELRKRNGVEEELERLELVT